MIWTSPSGDTYITTPGSALLVPTLCEPTGALPAVAERPTKRCTEPSTAMPQRRTTRAQNWAARVEAERRLNRHHREADERWQQQLHAITTTHDPPPF